MEDYNKDPCVRLFFAVASFSYPARKKSLILRLRSITLFILKASYLVKWSISTMGSCLDMIFHVVVSVYRLVKIWNSPQFPVEFRNGLLWWVTVLVFEKMAIYPHGEGSAWNYAQYGCAMQMLLLPRKICKAYIKSFLSIDEIFQTWSLARGQN